MAIELAAALVETGGFAAIIDAGASVAPTLGIDRFDGLLSQFEQRTRDPARPLELLYVTWRCGLLPLELDRKASVDAVEAAVEAAALGCTRCIIAAPSVDDPDFRLFASLGTVVLIATPGDLASGRLASAIGSAAGANVAGVIITHLEAAAPSTSTDDPTQQADAIVESPVEPDANSAPEAQDAVAAELADDAEPSAIVEPVADSDAEPAATPEATREPDGADIAVHPPMNDDGVAAPAESIEQAD